VFNKKHDNLIVWLPMSPLYGYDNLNYLENAASIVNNGIEITINTINFSKTEDRKFQWFTSLSFTNVKTTVLALPENVDVISSDYNRIEAGHIYGEYYLAEYAGVDPTSGHELIFNPSTGGTIDAEVLTDEEYLGYRKVIEGKSPFPKFYGGLNNTFTYKGVELSFLFYFQGGNHILDMGKQSLQYIGPASTAEATITEEGIPLIWDSKMASRQSTRFLYDASYIRLQNMRLAYNIPDIVIKKVKISSAKVYLSAHNLLTFSKYKGWDPEVIGSNMGTNNPMRAGEIYFEMPHARIILLGIQLNI